jgi:Dolichyl-phosphate-mannose-protein mannosyltransferase
MLGIVPVLCFAALVVAYAAVCSAPGVVTRWRMAFLGAAVTWGLAVTAMTEVLSPFHLITFGWLLTLWFGAVLLSLAVSVRRVTGATLATLVQWPPLTRFEFWCLAAVATIVSGVGVVAVAAPPNNADSVVYHLPRVMHWVQNHTVAHYPTNIPRQLFRPPWSAFAIMHFEVLSGGDRWANLVQWFSMVGSVLGVSLIAKQLGADSRGQVLAAVIAATVPMGILQASSTQNDYVTSFWLVCLAYYVLRFDASPRITSALGVGASLALALLTKGTAYLYATPLLVWFTLSALRQLRGKALAPLLVVVVVALGPQYGHYARNSELWGYPLVVDVDRPFVNEMLSVPAVLSNVIRNMSVHAGTPSERVNRWMSRGIALVHVPLGIAVNEPRTTHDGEFYQVPFRRDEDSAGNPAHLALVMAATLCLVSRPRRAAHPPRLAAYALSLVAAFLIFCSSLKWNPVHSRLHLPLFVLWSSLVPLTVLGRRTDRMARWLAVVLIAASTLYVLRNDTRPLIGAGANRTVLNADKLDQMFGQLSSSARDRGVAEVQRAYVMAADAVRSQQCRRVGLDIGEFDPEYPLWVLLRAATPAATRVGHVNVTNVSAAASTVNPFSGRPPCAVIALRRGSDVVEPVGTTAMYREAWSSGPMRVGKEVLTLAVFTTPGEPETRHDGS